MPTTNYGTVVVDTSMVPYIRTNEVEFVAYNLKPFKLSKIFFDDIAVSAFCQNANKLVLDSKKTIVLSRNNASIIYANDIVYQGTSNTLNTFSGTVRTFTSASNTIVVRNLTGAFDRSAQLFVQNSSSGVTFANCNVTSVTDTDTSDSFFAGEGIIVPERNNCFATVISTVGENVLYVNKNYVSLNVTAVGGNTITAMGSHFKDGDVVYQTADGSKRYDLATFKGVVKYYNPLGASSTGALSVNPISGKLNANSTASSTDGRAFIWNSSNTSAQPLGLKEVNIADFAVGSNVQSVTNTSVKINVTSSIHRSSVFANSSPPNNLAVILNSVNVPTTANANLIYFVSGTGVGEIRRIVSISNQTVVVNSALSFTPDTTTHYSIGNFITDEYGSLPGVFHIPSFSTFKFKTGERVFTVIDTDKVSDPDYSMRASATYSAGGILKTTQRIQTTPTLAPLPELDADALVRPDSPSDRTYNSAANKTPITGSTGSTTPRIPLGDGLSQTFFTPKPDGNKSAYGIFCTSIDLFFKAKPVPGAFFNNAAYTSSSSLQLPVTVKIAEVQNGYPTKNYLASKTLQAKDVKVSTLPSVDVPSTATKFTFDDPVYLEPAREYAITIQSDSPDYELFIAELGAEVLGSTTPRRISEQPYSGVLFRAQNSSTWSPYQNQDLMFVLNKAVFNTSGSATFILKNTLTANVDVDRVMLVSSDLTFPAANVEYRLRGIFTSNNTYEGGSGIPLIPHKPIEYGLIADASGKNKNSFNRRRLISGNENSFILTTEFTTTSTDVSPIVNLERLATHGTTYYINNGGLSNTKISITNPGSGYNALSSTLSSNLIKGGSNTSLNNFAQLYRETFLANNANVGFYNVTVTGGGNNATGALGFAVANTDGLNTINYIVLPSTGAGYIETPSITIESGNATSNVQAYAVVNGETDKSGGNMLARYVSRQIVLEDGFESGDLRVFMDAIRTSVNDIQVYYKVLSGDDPDTIADKRWRRMEKVKDIFSKDGRTIIALEFRPSLTENRISYTENGTTYPIGGTFKTFQIKICLLSSDPATVPKVKNLRVIAVPEG